MVTLNIPVGRLADDASLAAKRAEIKEKLLKGQRLSIGGGGKVETNKTATTSIDIPSGKLADDASLAAKRAEIKEKLLKGQRLSIGDGGKVETNKTATTSIAIPSGKLADDASPAAKRAELKRKLLEGPKVKVALSTRACVVDKRGEASSISIPTGKLAYQWYENDPELLEMEKMAMAKAFDGFELGVLDDGRLYWIGDVTPGVYETKFGERKTYTLMAVYEQNHPRQAMGSSVHIYPVLPDVDDLIDFCGFRPSHLLPDSNGQYYLCTAEASDTKAGSTITTAASVLAWAIKWLTAYELVLTGDLPQSKFNEHHGI